MRIHKPLSGRIILNDIPIEEYVLEEYRKIYSIVSQSVYLFNTSIKDNILLYEKENKDKLEKPKIKKRIKGYDEKEEKKYN